MWEAVWEEYWRTFLRIQAAICLVVFAETLISHRLVVAAGFLVAMEAGAFIGAMWAARLRARRISGGRSVRRS